MSNLLVQDTSLIAIADAIREKTGSTELIAVKDMPTQIEDINGASPDCESVSFGVDGEFEEKYAITSARLNEIASETQRLANTEEALAPSQIVDNLQNVVDDDEFMEGTVSKIHNNTVTKIKPCLCYQDTTLTSVDCPNVIGVGRSSFYNCTNLANVNLPKVQTIDDLSFYECDGLINLEFPELEAIGTSSFENNSKLESFTAPKLTTINDRAFYGCYALKEINIPEVITINSALGDGTLSDNNLTSVNLPKVTFLGVSCFQSCRQLESVNAPELTVLNSHVFYNCLKLKNINTPLVTNIGNYSLDGTLIEDINGDTVSMPLIETIGNYGLSGCKNLKTVYLPIANTVGYGAFQNDTALTSCEFDMKVSFSNYIFNGCTSLSTVILRGDTMSTIGSTNVFTNTLIASGTGYIYVPSTLVDTYKANSNWATYATQIRAIEDWPDVCDGKEVVRNYTVDTTKEADYTFNKEYINYVDSYSLKTEYKYESAEEPIDSGRMTSLKIITNDKQSVEGVVIG